MLKYAQKASQNAWYRENNMIINTSTKNQSKRFAIASNKNDRYCLCYVVCSLYKLPGTNNVQMPNIFIVQVFKSAEYFTSF